MVALQKIKEFLAHKDLRNKALFTLFALLIYKIIAHVPVPGANIAVLQGAVQSSGLSGVSALLGGSLENFSIILMGLSPYINASIILQLMTVIVPKLEALSKEGQRGQKKINSYTRWLTLPLAFLQSYGMILLLDQFAGGASVIAPDMIFPAMVTITAATLLLMWIGELITEKGIGNGISILISVSIITIIPGVLGSTLSLGEGTDSLWLIVAIVAAVTIALTGFVVWFTEGMRHIPITYANQGKKGGAEKSSLPIRVNQAGMIPIIFGISLITFPSVVARLMQTSSNAGLQGVGESILRVFDPSNPSLWYIFGYFFLTIFFAYFYVSIVFKPEDLSDNLQKRGGFIPGVRPGSETTSYIKGVSTRLNFWGGLFIALVAVFPFVFSYFTQETGVGEVPLLISGAGIIIFVGVVLEIARKIKVELVMQDYDKFY